MSNSIIGTKDGYVTEDSLVTTAGSLTLGNGAVNGNLFSAQTQTSGQYGTFSIQTDGQWSYSLSNDLDVVQALAAGQSVTDTFLIDYDLQFFTTVKLTINGKNDTASISGDQSQTLNTASQTSISGKLKVDDNDTGESRFTPIARQDGTWGSFSLTAEGVTQYTLQANYNGASTNRVETFNITTADGTTASVKITISGTSANNAPLNGTSGNDTLVSTASNETITGGDGTDTAVFDGAAGQYTLSIDRASQTAYVADQQSNRDGQDTLRSTERLQFADVTLNLAIFDEAKTIPPAQLQKLEELYVAFFNRVPDADGLSYWITQLKSGKTINDIATSFYSAGIQYSSLTGFSEGMTVTDFINTIYRNVLGRVDGADTVGLNFWTQELNSGQATRGSLVNAILDAAHTYKGNATWGWVADLLDNKISVANTVAVTWGLNYNTPEQSIVQGMAIAAAVTPTDTQAALNLIGIQLDAL